MPTKTFRRPVRTYKTDLMCEECNTVMYKIYNHVHRCPLCGQEEFTRELFPQFDYKPMYPDYTEPNNEN